MPDFVDDKVNITFGFSGSMSGSWYVWAVVLGVVANTALWSSEWAFVTSERSQERRKGREMSR